MTSFTFSAEQLKSAPPEVRRWFENEILRALGPRTAAEDAASRLRAKTLAACSPEEVSAIYALISRNFLLTRVLFELARDTSSQAVLPQPLHALNLADIQRHTQIADPAQLLGCLNVINQALQQVRQDSEASLFAADEEGHLFVHEITHRSIRELWGHLTTQSVSGSAPWLDRDGASPAASAVPQPNTLRPEYAFGPTPFGQRAASFEPAPTASE